MIRAIAIDDEPPALKVTEDFCNRIPSLQLVKTFVRPNEALKYLNKFPVDLLFLDIQMPSMSGIDFYKAIKHETMVIFTTAHSRFAVEGFDLNAVDYLLKPFTFERFKKAIDKATELLTTSKQKEAAEKYLLVRADYSLHKIALSDILYIEGLDDYVKIHQESGKIIVARMTMKAIAEKLPATEFIRVHRSFVVPVKRIDRIHNKCISLAGKDIPIGTSYEENFLNMFKNLSSR